MEPVVAAVNIDKINVDQCQLDLDDGVMTTTTLQPATPMVAPAGLKGLVVADTAIGDVRGHEGFFHYRDRDALELARTSSLEAVWHHLLGLDGPSASFATDVARRRSSTRIDAAVLDAIAAATEDHASGLLAALPLVLPENRPLLDQSPTERWSDLLDLAAAVPTLLADLHARRIGRTPTPPDVGRSHAGDWVAMAMGAEPTAEQVRLIETYLIATIDHGFNASTFATRVVASTGTSALGAMSAGVAALAGPLHGGAPGRALDMINDIGEPSATEAWVTQRLERGEKIMGFGHAVYRADDPRSTLLRELAIEVAPMLGFGELVERAMEIEAKTLAVLRRWKPGATIVTNVEFYAGVVLHMAGLSADLFTPSFTVSRSIGWTAHVLEQMENNKIMRPSARYVGPTPRREEGRSRH